MEFLYTRALALLTHRDALFFSPEVRFRVEERTSSSEEPQNMQSAPVFRRTPEKKEPGRKTLTNELNSRAGTSIDRVQPFIGGEAMKMSS